MIVAQALVFGLIGGFALGFGLARALRPRSERELALREHARLLSKASRAYRFHNPGRANIYEEAAERVLASTPERKELGP